MKFCRVSSLFFVISISAGIKLRESSVDGGNSKRCSFLNGIYISVMRRIYNQGFHKELSTEVELMLTTSVLPDKCILLVEEIIPRGMYVDPDQMRDISEDTGLQTFVGVKVDIEKPDFESEPFRFFIFRDLKIQENLRVTSVSFPIHLRYHKPSSPPATNGDQSFETSATSPSAIVKLQNPRLLLRCEEADDEDSLANFHEICPERIATTHCDSSGVEKCDYLILPYKVNTKNIEVSVPVGNTEHTPYVVGITTFIVSGGTIYIMVSLFRKCEVN